MRSNILSFKQSVFVKEAKIMFKVRDLFQGRLDNSLHASLRSVSNQNVRIQKPNLSILKDSITYSGPVICNSIPNEIKNFSTYSSFTQTVID